MANLLAPYPEFPSAHASGWTGSSGVMNMLQNQGRLYESLNVRLNAPLAGTLGHRELWMVQARSSRIPGLNAATPSQKTHLAFRLIRNTS